jgi:ribosome-associated translation inhibitor RaiA
MAKKIGAVAYCENSAHTFDGVNASMNNIIKKHKIKIKIKRIERMGERWMDFITSKEGIVMAKKIGAVAYCENSTHTFDGVNASMNKIVKKKKNKKNKKNRKNGRKADGFRNVEGGDCDGEKNRSCGILRK